MAEYIELIDKYLIVQSEDTDYNPPTYKWVDNTGEIVRCKDCKNADYSGMGKGSVWCNEMERAISEDGWCFKGDKEIEMPIVRGNNAI